MSYSIHEGIAGKYRSLQPSAFTSRFMTFLTCHV